MCKAKITLEDVIPRKLIQTQKDRCGIICRSKDQQTVC